MISVAKTVVIKERTAEAPKFAEVFGSAEIDTALRRLFDPVEFTGDVRAVTPTEMLAVESFLRRRTEIPDHPRQWLAWRIALPLMEKIRPAYESDRLYVRGFPGRVDRAPTAAEIV